MGISKYDIPMDMIVKNQGSQGKILAQISPGAFVLECGCSTGYMTRYMTEVIGANVYIIECDEESYKQAIQFAEDGICTDLSENKWLTKYFLDIQFDSDNNSEDSAKYILESLSSTLGKITCFDILFFFT